MPRIELEYRAPSGCGSRAEILDRLSDLWERAPKASSALKASILVETSGTHYILTYKTSSEGAPVERQLELESCAAAVEAAAFLLMLSVDPSLGSTESLEETSPAPSPPSGPAAEPTQATEAPPKAAKERGDPPPEVRPSSSKRRAPRRTPWVGFVGLSGAGSALLTPSPVLGGSASLGARWGWLSLRLRGGLQGSLDATSEDGAIELSSVLGDFGGQIGVLFPWGPVSLGPYLGGGVNVLQISTDSLASGGSGSTPLLYGSAGATALYQVGRRWAFEFAFGLMIPLERPAFFATGLENPVYRPGPVGLECTFGINWFFGSQ